MLILTETASKGRFSTTNLTGWGLSTHMTSTLRFVYNNTVNDRLCCSTVDWLIPNAVVGHVHERSMASGS